MQVQNVVPTVHTVKTCLPPLQSLRNIREYDENGRKLTVSSMGANCKDDVDIISREIAPEIIETVDKMDSVTGFGNFCAER